VQLFRKIGLSLQWCPQFVTLKGDTVIEKVRILREATNDIFAKFLLRAKFPLALRKPLE